ncbi:SH3 domain-containing protein [Terrisporobacter sp.]
MRKNKLKKYIIVFLSIATISSLSVVTKAKSQEIEVNAQAVTSKFNVKVISTGTATIDGVSVRSKNSASSTYLDSLRTGDKIEIVEKMGNGWYKIKYKNSYAYVSREFIKLSGTKTVDKVLNTGVVCNTTKLTVRESCSTSSKFLGYIPKNTKVSIVRVTSTNWYKIKYKNSYAYVIGKYIKLTPSENVISRGTVTSTTLNVRKSKSTSSAKLATLKKGARVAIVKKESNGWYKIKYNDKYGYISNKYVRIISSNAANRKNLNDFLFVGDSFTARMEKTIKNNNEAVYVHAQGGSRSSYWLDKVDEMPDKNLVDSVSILIGVNGVTTSNNITNTKALINQLIVKYPNKTIYVQRVFPVAKSFTEGNPETYNKAITEYNKKLKAFCDTKSNIKIIDATNGFIDKNGYLINTSDGLHIREDKNSIFYNNIFNAIKTAERSK